MPRAGENMMIHWKAVQLSADFGKPDGVEYQTILHK
jgi:hypothetical protein